MSTDPTEPDDAEETGESVDTTAEEREGATATGTSEPTGTAGTASGADSTLVGTESGLDRNVAGALCYLLGPLTGILFYVLEDDDEFVRFHGAQSTIVFGGLFVIGFALSIAATVLAIIPVIGWVFAALLGLVSLLLAPVGFFLWLFLMYKAYTGEEFELPWAGKYARRYSPKDADPTANAGGAI